ncbi:MAG: cupin domain-containing protein [Candidatus Edwardsbacteria bacterium]|nr:cupin domain-containing protein [Candidatus Edwardsbacteria bacterium]
MNRTNAERRARSIELRPSPDGYQRLLGGPPDSFCLRAGLVALAPGTSVGKHNTEEYEELIVALVGRGVMVSDDGSETPIDAGHFCYCPPHTGHDVKNTGTEQLRYVYIVTKTK